MLAWLKGGYARLKGKPQFSLSPQALPLKNCREIAEVMLQSPYLERNVLNGRFASTRGFSVIFQHRHDVEALFPELQDALDALALCSHCNLFYLNLLVLEQAAHVERHIDHSIRGYDATLPFPHEVSVLYLQAPPMQGGRLLLFDRQDQIAQRIAPQTGLLLRFPGHSKHAVEAVESSGTERVSLVCEQYRLSKSQLQALPEFTLKSSADFQSFLKQVR